MKGNKIFKVAGHIRERQALVAANDIDATAVLCLCSPLHHSHSFYRQARVSQSLLDMTVLTSRLSLQTVTVRDTAH